MGTTRCPVAYNGTVGKLGGTENSRKRQEAEVHSVLDGARGQGLEARPRDVLGYCRW